VLTQSLVPRTCFTFPTSATAYLCQWRFIAATEGFEQAAVEITE
jgi:hypothetical protein